jgi:hypothetical protein
MVYELASPARISPVAEHGMLVRTGKTGVALLCLPCVEKNGDAPFSNGVV